MMVGRLEGSAGAGKKFRVYFFFLFCHRSCRKGRGVRLGPNVQCLGCSRGPACSSSTAMYCHVLPCKRPECDRAPQPFLKFAVPGTE